MSTDTRTEPELTRNTLREWLDNDRFMLRLQTAPDPHGVTGWLLTGVGGGDYLSFEFSAFNGDELHVRQAAHGSCTDGARIMSFEGLFSDLEHKWTYENKPFCRPGQIVIREVQAAPPEWTIADPHEWRDIDPNTPAAATAYDAVRTLLNVLSATLRTMNHHNIEPAKRPERDALLDALTVANRRLTKYTRVLHKQLRAERRRHAQ